MEKYGAHKAYCTCETCIKARNVNKTIKRMPQSVRFKMAAKRAQEEELMLWKGFILQACPACKHTSYMKIGPIMTCSCCCHKIQ